MKIKFCGINKIKYAQMAVDLKADYVGFLVGITHFAEDKLTNQEALKIIDNIDFGVSVPIAVTHLTTAREVISTMREIHVSAVQLHDNISVDEIKIIRDAMPDAYIIKAIHVTPDENSIERALEYQEYVDSLLLDSRTAERLGGTGEIHDWNISAELVKTVSKPVFLAGGLRPENLRAAINAVHPYGVDVNSGVEINGEKVFDMMRLFADIAREY